MSGWGWGWDIVWWGTLGGNLLGAWLWVWNLHRFRQVLKGAHVHSAMLLAMVHELEVLRQDLRNKTYE